MWNWIAELERLRREARPVALLTVVRVVGSAPRSEGTRMLVTADGAFQGTIGGGHLEQLALEEARTHLGQVLRGELADTTAKNLSFPLGTKTGQCCGGHVELLLETLNAGPQLYVFGAGHVGQAVARVFSGTPFTVHLIDERPEWIGPTAALPADAVRHDEAWIDFLDRASWDPVRSYVTVMTHRHDDDEEIVRRLLDAPLRYLGLIGSRAKWRRFTQRYGQRGLSRETLERVTCPIGLRTGGKAPQEIAISLAAQLLQIHYGHVGASWETTHEFDDDDEDAAPSSTAPDLTLRR
jgi:xanthine dehydrogenase accessory factor